MSDKLAISAAFSVLMMAAYVLFGGDTVRVPFGTDARLAPVEISAPSFDAQALLR